jgi:hypothetical protein
MGECLNCNKETENKVTIVNNFGIGHSYSPEFLCKDCHKPKLIGDNWFVKIKNKLYYEYNTDFGMFGCLENIDSKNQYDYLVNQRYCDMIKDIEFNY